MKPISRSDFIKRLRSFGFDGPFAGGKHSFENKLVPIPNPHKGDIGVGLLIRILKQAGISTSEWESYKD